MQKYAEVCRSMNKYAEVCTSILRNGIMVM